jgi:mannose/fructose/N-acetylgalactosamine-specific phosphotransferase system component IIB
MKIALIRIDDRLIHGQITMGWSRSVGANVILVANDAVANDPMQRSLMTMAVPPGIKAEVFTVDEAAQQITSDALGNVTVLLLVRSPIDFLRLMEKGVKVDMVNVGGVRPLGATIKLTKEVSATPEELEAWKKVDAAGVRIEVAFLPGNRPTILNDVLKKY